MREPVHGEKVVKPQSAKQDEEQFERFLQAVRELKITESVEDFTLRLEKIVAANRAAGPLAAAKRFPRKPGRDR